MTLKKTIAAGALALVTCLTIPAGFARVTVSIGAPPPPPAVAPGPFGITPGPAYVWTNGYWDWTGGNWVWIGGRWALPPHGHHVWVEPNYHEHGDRFHYHRGHWR